MNYISGVASKEKSPTNGVMHHHKAVDSDKKMVTALYKECMKNHAAALGGNARDGCGEYMPTSCTATTKEKQSEQQEDGEGSLMCSACGCHRNFHRKVIVQYNELGERVEDNGDAFPCYYHQHSFSTYNNDVLELCGPAPNDRKVFGKGSSDPPRKKRFRTKFTEEQKEKMMKFAEEAGWGMQKLDGSVIDNFCQELGIKRRVLKVWMHNNKHKRFESS